MKGLVEPLLSREALGFVNCAVYTQSIRTYLPVIHERKRHVVQFKYGYPQKVTNNNWVVFFKTKKSLQTDYFISRGLLYKKTWTTWHVDYKRLKLPFFDERIGNCMLAHTS